jgi:hypothetical protein
METRTAALPLYSFYNEWSRLTCVAVDQTAQSLAVSKKRPALQGEKGEEEEEEASDYDEDDYSDDDEEEEEGELAGLPVISSQRHKRLQVRTHRDFRMCLNSGQSMNLMTVIREYRYLVLLLPFPFFLLGRFLRNVRC